MEICYVLQRLAAILKFYTEEEDIMVENTSYYFPIIYTFVIREMWLNTCTFHPHQGSHTTPAKHLVYQPRGGQYWMFVGPSLDTTSGVKPRRRRISACRNFGLAGRTASDDWSFTASSCFFANASVLFCSKSSRSDFFNSIRVGFRYRSIFVTWILLIGRGCK